MARGGNKQKKHCVGKRKHILPLWSSEVSLVPTSNSLMTKARLQSPPFSIQLYAGCCSSLVYTCSSVEWLVPLTSSFITPADVQGTHALTVCLSTKARPFLIIIAFFMNLWQPEGVENPCLAAGQGLSWWRHVLTGCTNRRDDCTWENWWCGSFPPPQISNAGLLIEIIKVWYCDPLQNKNKHGSPGLCSTISHTQQNTCVGVPSDFTAHSSKIQITGFTAIR